MRLGTFSLNTIQARCIHKLEALHYQRTNETVDLHDESSVVELLKVSCASDERLVLDYAELFALASLGDIRKRLEKLGIDLNLPSKRKALISRSVKKAKTDRRELPREDYHESINSSRKARSTPTRALTS